MNYEKKYNEALKRAKAAIDIAADKDLVKGVASTIFPELRESEDERIRKEMISFLHSPFIKENLTDEKVAPWLDWLEKQKELMPPVDVDPCDASWDAYYQRGLNKGYELGLEAGMKEQKPFSQEDFDSTKHEALWEEQKHELVQHPPITYTYPSDASRDEQLKLALIALLNNDLIQVRGSKFTKQDLIDWVEQKPAEWSEEDEKIEKAIESVIRIYGKTQGEFIAGYDMDTLIVHLRTAFNRNHSWNDKGKDVIVEILRGLHKGILYEEAQEIADEILKSLRPQPSWKPSKEEMEALDVACSGKLWYGEIYLEGLKRIREQLKKLYL